MRRKTAIMGDYNNVIYEKEQWEILESLRKKAAIVMSALKDAGFHSLIHGSVARGDVSKTSDIDIFIPMVVQSFKLELTLDNLDIVGRKLIQATPSGLIKGHIYLPCNTMVTFPLVQPTNRELDFYAFGGQLGLDNLEDFLNNRVPGVDKRLMLIEPMPDGHLESPLSDMSPGVVARKIGVGQDIIDERIRVLKRRAQVGITGVYIDRPLFSDEGFEEVLEEIKATDSFVRRRTGIR
ncbi:MAG TPA: nucleotidyltransferase domain-containing protein [archaeon]|nr:nucleotidyltransferase domain-containing protein [archaeon]